MYEGYMNDYGAPEYEGKFIALYKKMETPPIKWLVKDVLKERGIGILFGSSGAMKSYASVDLACRMVNGMDFHGKPMEQGNVIYIAGEAADETAERIEAWLEYHGKTERPLLCPWAVQIHNRDHMTDLVMLVKKVGNVKLVIFDNLADCSVGVRLNEPDDVGEHIKPAALSFVKEARAAMLMLHHTGHDNAEERGARVLRDMTDTSIKAEKQKNNFDLVWTMRKLRRMQAGAKIDFHIKDISQQVGIDNAAIILSGKRGEAVDLTTGEIVDETPDNVVELRTASERLEAFIAEQGGRASVESVIDNFDWRRENGKAKSTYYDALKGTRQVEKDGEYLVLVPTTDFYVGTAAD